MNNQKYFWQGEPVKTDFGVAYPIENTEKPLFWYNLANLKAKRYSTRLTILLSKWICSKINNYKNIL